LAIGRLAIVDLVIVDLAIVDLAIVDLAIVDLANVLCITDRENSLAKKNFFLIEPRSGVRIVAPAGAKRRPG